MIRGHKFLLTLGLGALRLLTSLGKHGVADLGSGLPALGQALGRSASVLPGGPHGRAGWAGGTNAQRARAVLDGTLRVCLCVPCL